MSDNKIHYDHSKLEDEYFHLREQELINKIRAQELEKKQIIERSTHLQKCGSCGHNMEKFKFQTSDALACSHCDSVLIGVDTLRNLSASNKTKAMLSELEDSLRSSRRKEKESA